MTGGGLSDPLIHEVSGEGTFHCKQFAAVLNCKPWVLPPLVNSWIVFIL